MVLNQLPEYLPRKPPAIAYHLSKEKINLCRLCVTIMKFWACPGMPVVRRLKRYFVSLHVCIIPMSIPAINSLRKSLKILMKHTMFFLMTKNGLTIIDNCRELLNAVPLACETSPHATVLIPAMVQNLISGNLRTLVPKIPKDPVWFLRHHPIVVMWKLV